LLSRRDYPTARRLHGHIRIQRPDLVVCLGPLATLLNPARRPRGVNRHTDGFIATVQLVAARLGERKDCRTASY
jgi:hypothetical protein